MIKVTRRQVETAQDRVDMDKLLGRESDPAVVAIANAKQVAVRTRGHDVPKGYTAIQTMLLQAISAHEDTQEDFRLV